MGTTPSARRAAVLALGLAAWGALGVQTAGHLAGATLWDYGMLRRVWQDSAAAMASYLEAAHPLREGREHRARGDMLHVARVTLPDRAYREAVRPWQFWRTLRVEPFLRERGPAEVDAFDDPGRAALMAAGYRALGGISPFLLFWVGWLAAGPVVVWLVAELSAVGPRAAASGAAVLAVMPFLPEAFALPRSAVGFYVIAVLALGAYAVGCVFGRPAPRPVALRTCAAAVVLAMCTYCRSGSVLLLPGFAVAALIAARRVAAERRWPRARAAALAAVLLLALALPSIAMRGEGRRDTWLGVWEGLGDYDRVRGHAWADEDAEAFLRRRGIPDPIRSAPAEAAFRADVLLGIRESPSWFAGIVARRAVATILQTRLWPWAPWGGESVAPATTPNEGYIRKYYGYVTPIDHVGFIPWRLELPVPLLFLPASVLGFLAWRRARADGARRALLALGCVALGTAVLPIALTSAGAIETQAFALVYVLALPLVLSTRRIA